MTNELTKIELIGAIRYGYKGEKYEQGVHYLVKTDRARLLLRLTTDKGFHVFREVGKDFQPVATRRAEKQTRKALVVDTTKTEAEQYDERLIEAAKDAADEEAPVVVQPHASKKKRPKDITEEEAEAALADEDSIAV